MELTIRDIISANAALNKLAAVKVRDRKIFYWVTVTQSKLRHVVEAFEKTRDSLLADYAVTQEDGTIRFKSVADKNQFTKMMDEILQKTETIDARVIKLSALFADASLDLTPEIVGALGQLVEIDDEMEN